MLALLVLGKRKANRQYSHPIDDQSCHASNTDHYQFQPGAFYRSHFHLFCRKILRMEFPSHSASETNTNMDVIDRPDGKEDIGYNYTFLVPPYRYDLSMRRDANRCRTSLRLSSNGAGTKDHLKTVWIAHRCCSSSRSI